MAPVRRTHRAWPMVVRGRTSGVEIRKVRFGPTIRLRPPVVGQFLTVQKVYQLQSFRSEVFARVDEAYGPLLGDIPYAPSQIRKDPNWKYRSAVHDRGAFENRCLSVGGHHR